MIHRLSFASAASIFAIVGGCGTVCWFTKAFATERLTLASRATLEMPAARTRVRSASYFLRESRYITGSVALAAQP